MKTRALQAFLDRCRQTLAEDGAPADRVYALLPAMFELLHGAGDFLEPGHFRADPAHYARNAIHVEADGGFSLYALVWSPGQFTPIHDHGTWGVVGVHEGVLHEKSYIRIDGGERSATTGIELARGGVIALSPGSVTSFVPNPDHIHLTGNPDPARRVVSLHLYGRAMDGFHIYDREARTRRWVEVGHNES